MKRFLITSFIVFIFISGCAMPAKQSSFVSTGFNDFSLIVEGERIQSFNPRQIHDKRVSDHKIVKATREHLEKVLKGTGFTLETSEGRNELRDRLMKLQNPWRKTKEDLDRERRKPNPRAFHGISGFSTVLAFQSALGLMDGNSDRPDAVKGRIREFVFLVDNPQRTTGHGHLTVEVYIDHYDENDVLFQQEVVHWDVEVKREGYDIVKREGAPDNVPNEGGIFPRTIVLPPEKRNPRDRRSVWVRNLNYKLYAEGDDIIVRNVYQKINDGPIRRYPDGHEFYTSTEESCIDIMFDGFPPAMELPPQVGYCLGRCAHPYIMNSE